MPQCQFLFSAVFDSRKVTKEIFSESTKEVILRSFIPKESRSQKGAPGGAWWAHTTPRRAWALLAAPGHGVAHQNTSRVRPFAYLFPRTENPKNSRNFPKRSP